MRKAIALIELVFAIVVIAITLLAVPNLIATTTKASNSAISQEAISNAVSHIDMVMSQFWDENSTNPKYNNPVLKMPTISGYTPTPAFDLAKDFTNNTSGYMVGRRVGSAISTTRRFAINSDGKILTASINLRKEEPATENPDDVDDFDNSTYTLVDRETIKAEDGDYKDQKIDIKTTVSYIKDIYILPPITYNKKDIFFPDPFNYPSTQPTNIKSIKVVLTSRNDPNKKVVLRAFSCNIGSSRLKEKKFWKKLLLL